MRLGVRLALHQRLCEMGLSGTLCSGAMPLTRSAGKTTQSNSLRRAPNNKRDAP